MLLRSRLWPSRGLRGSTLVELRRVGDCSPTLTVAIVDLVQSGGGVMSMKDLESCTAEVIEPIKYDFKHDEGDGLSLWEVR